MMPRFVILEHDYPALHWDFMLEAGPVLRTWRLSAAPEAGCAVEAVASFNHRAVYLDYEGPVSGNRGTVKRWEAGTFTYLVDDVERVSVDLQGIRLRGHADLQLLAADKWSFCYKPSLA
jgi:hypothetical protein